MKNVRTKSLGVSFLETLVALLILTLTLWSIQTVYVGLLRGTTKNEERQKAAVVAEDILLEWKSKAVDQWDIGSFSDIQDGYYYEVTLSDLLADPLGEATDKLSMRILTVRVYYSRRELTLDDLPTAPGQTLRVELHAGVSR